MAMRIMHRVFERHPDLSRSDVESAWEYRLKTQFRVDGEKPYMVAVGVASSGKAIELIAFDDGGDTVIFHAFSPPTRKLLAELNMI